MHDKDMISGQFALGVLVVLMAFWGLRTSGWVNETFGGSTPKCTCTEYSKIQQCACMSGWMSIVGLGVGAYLVADCVIQNKY